MNNFTVFLFFFFSSRRRHTRLQGDWSSDVCSSDLAPEFAPDVGVERPEIDAGLLRRVENGLGLERHELGAALTLVENRKGGGTVWRYGVEQLQLPGPLR